MLNSNRVMVIYYLGYSFSFPVLPQLIIPSLTNLWSVFFLFPFLDIAFGKCQQVQLLKYEYFLSYTITPSKSLHYSAFGLGVQTNKKNLLPISLSNMYCITTTQAAVLAPNPQNQSENKEKLTQLHWSPWITVL